MKAKETTSLQSLLDNYGITDRDLELVRKHGEVLVPQLEEIVDEFYDWLPNLPEFGDFFPTRESTTRLRKLQYNYWTVFFEAKVDDSYVAARRRVGNVHATIGLSLQAYFAAMNAMLLALTRRLDGVDGAGAGVLAITKLHHFDTAIVVQAFSEHTALTIREQSEAIMAMSTPVTAIWDNILLLPVVGIIDSKRSQDIMAAMLERVRDTEAEVFILDISGVAVVDTAVANHLIKMTQAVRLMGCQCIISGISPAIARTVVELGVNVASLNTTGRLKDALAFAFAQTGVTLSAAR